jgi:hypothetical protein
MERVRELESLLPPQEERWKIPLALLERRDWEIPKEKG